MLFLEERHLETKGFSSYQGSIPRREKNFWTMPFKRVSPNGVTRPYTFVFATYWLYAKFVKGIFVTLLPYLGKDFRTRAYWQTSRLLATSTTYGYS
jgi:hypothetical protein